MQYFRNELVDIGYAALLNCMILCEPKCPDIPYPYRTQNNYFCEPENIRVC